MNQPAKKAKLIPLSSVSWDRVRALFGFSAFGLGALSVRYVPFSSPTTIDEIISRLTVLERLYGKITTGNEAKRLRFIDVFVEKIALEKGLFVAPEMALTSDTRHGTCEYVLLVPTPPTMVVVIIEAKAGDLDEGRAQCVLQLVAAAVENAYHGFTPSAYFGVVTTADYWVLIRYDPAKVGAEAWQEAELGSVLSTTATQGERFDRVTVTKICGAILWAIDTVLPQVARFQQKPTRAPLADVAHRSLSLRDATERLVKAVTGAAAVVGDRPVGDTADQ